MALSPVSTTGALLQVAAEEPATQDAAGVNALGWQTFIDYDAIPDMGEVFETGQFDGLRNGRIRFRQIKDAGETTTNIPIDAIATDTALDIVAAAFAAASGSGNDIISMRVVDGSNIFDFARFLVLGFRKVGASGIFVRELRLSAIPGSGLTGSAV